ncbi:MAG TPA: MFS transporter [Bacteroidales bacterium]|nr:MFS transporter [Bacteroidales bacterium]
MRLLEPLKTLREPLFSRLYIAQGISLLGDSITWLGIALLAYEFSPEGSSGILATALTLRVTAFILFGSYAGIIADSFSRKKIMVITNMFRMFIVISLVFVNSIWQLYILIFLLNIFNAFFSPAYKATIPQLISRKENYGDAIALSNATWEILGILGPGLAGAIAVAWGSRDIFFVDAFTFLVSSILVLFIPIPSVTGGKRVSLDISTTLSDMKTGTKLVFRTAPVRFATIIELSSALAGAQILVNTIGHVKGDLMLGDDEYGLIMASFGAGATIAAFTSNSLDRSKGKTGILIAGALMIGLALLPANFIPYKYIIILWVMAGLGISYADMPSQILIAENISKDQQGKAYGSHFAWTHVWWATGYSIAGITGTYLRGYEFLTGGLLSVIFTAVLIFFRFRKRE